MKKYEKPKCLASSIATFKRVAPCPEKSCVYNPPKRTLDEIERDITDVENKISKGIDAGTAWNSTISQYNELCHEYSKALEKKNKK